jgi:hypothetical protein
MSYKWLVPVVAAALCCAARAEEKTYKVLAVGNSFSANAMRYFGDIVKASGRTVVAKNAMIGGCDFERHMRHAEAFEANSDAPEGRPYPGKQSLKELLTSEHWDVVTIQQVSHKSFRPETFHPHADRLIAYIKKYAPQAEIAVHAVWAYRDDHKWFKDRATYAEMPLNTDEMFKRASATYEQFAKENGFRLIPSVYAIESARRDPAYGKAGKQTLSKDCFHCAPEGEYLLGCVWLEFLLGQSALGNAFVPKGVGAEDAALLQRIAHRVVTEKERPAPVE